jgi:class 3 adenylate cyclase
MESLGVFFADISDSTSLFKTYGDERARDIVIECMTLLGDVVTSFGGTVVERIGDELLCTFPTAEMAAKTSIEIQGAIERARCSGRLSHMIEIRVGFHFGPVLREDDRLFGDTVYKAKRVSTLAKGQQILTTAETLQSLGSEWEALTRFVDRTNVKGKEEIFEVHEVIWDARLLTIDEAPPRKDGAPDPEMRLMFSGEIRFLNESHALFTIGRSQQCHFFVDDKRVSRLHARIEFRKGRFVLTDVSRNGTVVVNDMGVGTLVHRGEFVLVGSGSVYFGAKDRGSEEKALKFCLEGTSPPATS